MRFSWFPRQNILPASRPLSPRRSRLHVEVLEDRSLPSVTLLSNFDGVDFAGSLDGAPPDTIAAAGPSHIVEMVNTDIAIYTKAGAQVFHQDLSQFFAAVQTGNALSDPVVIYDEQAGRFVVGVLDLSISFFGTVNSDAFLYAVSDSSDPTQDTSGDGKAFSEMHSIDMTESAGGSTLFADYPRIGSNADGYFVSFNMFTTGFFNVYDHASVISIGKAGATDANNATFTSFLRDVPGGVTHSTLAPATMHDSVASTPGSPQPIYFVEEKLDANGNPVGNALRVVTGTNLLSASPVFAFTDVNVASYTAPPAATQQGASTLLATNDSRMLNAEWRNNRLVAAQCVGVASDAQAHARWYEFNTSGAASLTQQGTIGLGSGANSYYPAIAIAPNGDLGMNFVQSSASEFVSMYVTGHSSGDAAGTMQTPALVIAGQTAYSATFDSSPFRAGDYSGITIDPLDGSFWAANEYAKTPTDPQANWGTRIGHFTLGPAGPDVTAPTVTVTAPNGGQNWTAGTVHNITWSAVDNVGVTSVDLLYSTTGAAGTFTAIASAIANTGTFAWTVPNTPTTNAIVKVVARDAVPNTGQDLSNAVFTIAQPDTTLPTVTVTAPNGGESWAAGSVHNITWTANDNVGVTSVDLLYSTNGGGSFTAIASGLANTGTYTWTVPNSPSTNAIVKAVARDAAGNTGQDVSNAAFTITAPAGNANNIYVWDMAWSDSTKGGTLTVTVKVTVRRDSNANGSADATDALASNVLTTLVMDHYYGGSYLTSTTFVNVKTNGSGQAVFNLKTQLGGDFRATITSMTKSGLTWNPQLDKNNPSNYLGAPGGHEATIATFPTSEPRLTLTSQNNTAGEIPPMLLNSGNGAPTLPATAFHSESPLFTFEEYIPIGVLAPRKGGKGSTGKTP